MVPPCHHVSEMISLGMILTHQISIQVHLIILIKTNLNTIQTLPFIGKSLWLTFPLNMLKTWTPLGVFLTFLIPGKPCLGLLLLSWVWTTRKADRSLGLEASSSMLPLSSIIKDAFDKIFRPLIYLRVNTSNLFPPLQSGTRWDSLVMRTKSRS